MITPTRDNFDNSKAIVRKLFGFGKYAVGSDMNEVGQAADDRLSQVLKLLAVDGIRFGTGWTITGGTNQVTVSAGSAAVETIDDRAHVLDLASNTDVTGWTTPSGGGRTDYLYLDIEFEQVDPTGDSSLLHPDVDEETVNDIRLTYAFTKQEGGSVPSAPAGHYYFTIATITRSDGVDTIADGDIENHLHKWDPLQVYESVEREVIYAQTLAASYGSGGNEPIEWTAARFESEGGAGSGFDTKLRIAFYKKPNTKTVHVRCQASNVYVTAELAVRLDVNGVGYSDISVPQNSGWAYYTTSVDISGASANDDITIELQLQDTIGGGLLVTKVLIWAESEVLA